MWVASRGHRSRDARTPAARRRRRVRPARLRRHPRGRHRRRGRVSNGALYAHFDSKPSCWRGCAPTGASLMAELFDADRPVDHRAAGGGGAQAAPPPRRRRLPRREALVAARRARTWPAHARLHRAKADWLAELVRIGQAGGELDTGLSPSARPLLLRCWPWAARWSPRPARVGDASGGPCSPRVRIATERRSPPHRQETAVRSSSVRDLPRTVACYDWPTSSVSVRAGYGTSWAPARCRPARRHPAWPRHCPSADQCTRGE
jgi:hypothetical protein